MKEGPQTRAAFARLAPHVAAYRAPLASGALCMTVATAGQLSLPLILKSMIDTAIPSGDTGRMAALAFAYLGVVLATGAAGFGQNIWLSRVGIGVVSSLKKQLFEHLLTLPVSYFDHHPVGELISRTESDTERVRELFSRTGVGLVAGAALFLGMVAVCMALQPAVTLWIVLLAPPLMAAVLWSFDKLIPRYEKSRSLNAKISGLIAETLQAFEAVKAFGRESWATARLDRAAAEKRDNDISTMVMERLAMGLLGFAIGPLFMVAVILTFAPRIAQGAMTIGTLLVFLDYGRRLLDPLMEIAENVRALQASRVSLGRILALFDLKPEGSGGTAPAGRIGSIELRDVWFAYGDEWVLRGVSFTVRPGRKIALVGPSGSGKSTVVNLLCKFHAPGKGSILVDGKDLQEIETAAWRRRLGLVLQEAYLFPGSVLENVRVYDDSVPAHKVREALASAQAMDLVARLPDGEDSAIRERGANLSAGERQLLSFARAIAADPDVIILDEATASVDMPTEAKIRAAMGDLTSGRTTVVVAHRLSSVLDADEILFFREGRIEARGAHRELMRACPEYARLVALQFPDAANGSGAEAGS